MSRLFALTLVALAGCHVDLNDPGTEPSATALYFPAGLAHDPVEPILYVSNGNSDLRFSGGTVQMVDLARHACAERAFRLAQGETVAPLPADICPFADGDRAGCLYDPLDPSVVDCDANFFVDGNSTVKVGNFAGNMVLRVPPGSDTRQLFVGVRGDPSLTEIDATPSGTGRRLNCFDPTSDVSRATTPPACQASHLIQFYDCQGQPNCTQGTNDAKPGQQLIPTEPFGLTLDQGKLASGDDYSRILVSHLAGGQVSIIDVLKFGDERGQIPYISNAFFMEDAQHRHGAFDLAPQHPGAGASTLWYLTSNLQPTIATFRVADVNVVVPSLTFDIRGSFAGGGDVRAVAFTPDGSRMFTTENNPPSLLVFDTQPVTPAGVPGTNANQLIDVVDVCLTPSHLQMSTLRWQGPPGTPPQERTRLYVVCFLSNQVMVVDPNRPGVDDTILVGRGPNDVTFGTDPLTGQPRGYVTNFSENTISVLDLQPGSPTENRMVARIGIPLPPPKP
jgi:hypothetical protein